MVRHALLIAHITQSLAGTPCHVDMPIYRTLVDIIACSRFSRMCLLDSAQKRVAARRFIFLVACNLYRYLFNHSTL